jgi:type IV pilus assembly protein PilN
MKISLNLATRPYADFGPAIKRLRIGMGVLALLSALLLFGLHIFHKKAEEARARERALDARIAVITRERQGYEAMMLQPANAQLLVEAGVLNRLFDEKDFSWTLAMEDLENVLPGGVQVTTLDPTRDKTGRITLRLRVVGPRDRGVELVQNLEHSRFFLLPRIAGESSESTGDTQQRLEPISASNRTNFDLLADYNPSAPRDRRPVKKPVADDVHAPVPAPHAGLPAQPNFHPGMIRPPSSPRPYQPDQPGMRSMNRPMNQPMHQAGGAR